MHLFALPTQCREIVLFGMPLDPARYKAVLHACALLPDLRAWPAGDHTIGGPADGRPWRWVWGSGIATATPVLDGWGPQNERLPAVSMLSACHAGP